MFKKGPDAKQRVNEGALVTYIKAVPHYEDGFDFDETMKFQVF